MHKVAIICCSNILLFYQCVNRWQGNLMTLLQTQSILPYLLILSCTCDKVIRVMVQKLKYNIIKKKKKHALGKCNSLASSLEVLLRSMEMSRRVARGTFFRYNNLPTFCCYSICDRWQIHCRLLEGPRDFTTFTAEIDILMCPPMHRSSELLIPLVVIHIHIVTMVKVTSLAR